MPHFITKTIHVYQDYPVALGLMIMPFLLGLGAEAPLAMWLSVITGVAAFVLTLLTDHHLGVFRVLPYSLHLAVDGMVGVAFVAFSFLFGLSGIDMAYYLVIGATVLVVVGLYQSEENGAMS